jgi:hypothetical protein
MLAVFFQGSLAAVNAADHLETLEREASFHIESGSLESALLQFSRQTGIQVVLTTRVADISVTAIEGRRNAREVLTLLLNTTGLKYSVVGETVTVSVDPKVRAAVVTPLDDPPKNVSETGRRH